MKKAYLYIGHYIDDQGNYILKIGTTNNLKRRLQEHNKYYKEKAKNNKTECNFRYDWYKTFSDKNVELYEKRNKEKLKKAGIGRYLPKDRFICEKKPTKITITIRRDYEIKL